MPARGELLHVLETDRLEIHTRVAVAADAQSVSAVDEGTAVPRVVLLMTLATSLLTERPDQLSMRAIHVIPDRGMTLDTGAIRDRREKLVVAGIAVVMGSLRMCGGQRTR